MSPFMVMSYSGGAGARPRQDGLSATPYPSGVRNVPVEYEAIHTVGCLEKNRANSGGAGRQRGGLGQTMERQTARMRPSAYTPSSGAFPATRPKQWR